MADAQYIIDILADMREGEHTRKELDALTSSMVHAGAGSESFSEAMVVLDAEMRRAQAASASTNAALSEAQASYKALEHAANRAAKAVERAGSKATREQIEAAEEASIALAIQSSSLRELEVSAARAATREQDLAQQMEHLDRVSSHVDDRLGRATRRMSTFRGALGDLGGVAGETGEALLKPAQAFVDLREEFGTANAAMTVAAFGFFRLAEMAAKVAGAVALATAAVGVMSVVAADNARSTDLQRDALSTLHPEFAAVRGEFAELADETGATEEQLQGLTESLIDAGVVAGDMPAALRAVAKAETALGQGGARDFIADLKAGRTEVGELADEVDAKFGGIVERRLLGLDKQSQRLKRALGGILASIDVEPVLRAFSHVVDIFSETTVTGQAMRELLKGVLQPIVDRAEDAALVLEAFVIGAQIAALKVYLALRDVFEFEDYSLNDLLETTMGLAEGLVYVFTGFAAATYAVYKALTFALDPLGKISTFFSELFGLPDLVSIGRDIVWGIIKGIFSVGFEVTKALVGLVSSGVDAVKRVLGIHSPSTVMQEVGRNTGEGFVGGVEDMQDPAAEAMSDMVEPPAARAFALGGIATPESASAGAASVAGGAPGSQAPSGGISISFAGAVLNFNGVAGAESIAPALADMITNLLEGDALSVGAPAT